jgi:FkbM family methyltransferase
MKIFLDVGAHIGETLEVAIEEKYSFDKIYCFEPVAENCKIISAKFNDPRIEVCEYGLWDKDCTMPLYNPGDMGASVFIDKPRRHDNGSKEAKFVNASNWFSQDLNFSDQVITKINCEGSECVILDDLIASGQYKKINVLMIDFDVRKIPSQKHLADEMKDKLSSLDIPKIFYAEDFNFGKRAHKVFTSNWLDLAKDWL